jgi:predicted permease
MFRRKRTAADFAEEMKAHLELEADELKSEGLTPEQAYRRARVEFGSRQAAHEHFRTRNRIAWVANLLRDLRFAFRTLSKSPGFAATAIFTLALGIGANTAVFSVMNAVLLRSLPVAEPRSLVFLRASHPPHRTGTIDSHGTFSYPVYLALRDQHSLFSDVIAVAALSGDKVPVRLGAVPELAEADMVSGNFFSGLGVSLVRGHGFNAEDEARNAPVMVISYNYWTRRFSRDPGVLGKTIYIKSVPFAVIGVAAEGFEGTEAGRSLDFWIPLQNRVEFNVLGNPPENGKLYQNDPTWWCLSLIARLAPGVSRAKAIAAAQPVFQRAAYIGLGSPERGEQLPVLSFAPARNFAGMDQAYNKPLRILMAMVALVLLIALTNVTMLLIARNSTRQREFSLRLALGAGRAVLLRQLLVEGLLLLIAGAALAWGFAVVATRMLGQWAQIQSSLAPDRNVLLFTLGIVVLSAVLFALAPFRLALAGGAQLALKTSAATSHRNSDQSRTARFIVAFQMALCVILLVGAGLLVRTLRNLENTPLGINTTGLVVFGLNPQGFHSEPQLVLFYRELQRRLGTLPGVESVAVMNARLGSGSSNNNFVHVDGRVVSDILVRENEVGPGLFHTLGVPLLQGREFNDADSTSKQYVCIVNQLFVDRFLPHQNPLGHKVEFFTIVGVVANHKYLGIAEQPVPMAFWDYEQAPNEGGLTVEMRVHGNALAILPAVNRTVAQMDPNAPLIEPMLQRTQFEDSISTQLMFARLAEFFGLLAIVLVATGLYGTLAYRVNTRTAEIGVRMAMGARRGQVVWMILRDTLLLTAIGVLAGVPLSYFVGRALASSLYGVKPLDLISYGVAVIGVAAVALAASATPAARAATVDPLKALRTE